MPDTLSGLDQWEDDMDRYDVGELLNRVSLEEVISRLGIGVERRGARTRALCPFHQDSRPSLSLFPSEVGSPAHYHCFACGAHGNAIDIVKHVEGLEFLPAVQWLVQQFGLQGLRLKASHQIERKATNEAALDFALQIFDAHHDSLRFGVWCDERGFTADFLHEQGLRCISRAVLVKALQEKAVGERTELIDGLLGLGLIKRLRATSKADQLKFDLPDQFQDCFHDGRVVIPIRDADAKQPKVVGFAGRALLTAPPEGVAKYLLTSGVEKAKHLFNASSALAAVADDVKNGRPSTLYLVEGFLDALRLQALGQRAVALMGVSLGKGQFELLEKFVGSLPPSATALAFSIFLDNDPAGFGGADRLARTLLGMTGVDLRWVAMPWRTEPALGKDPDACLRSMASPDEAKARLASYEVPAEAVLLVAALGSQDASELQDSRWGQLAPTARERAVFRAALAIHKLHGRRLWNDVLARLQDSPRRWANDLRLVLSGRDSDASTAGRGLYLEGAYARAALSRTLAYHGARRGELPCDEEVWLTLSGNARLFDLTALARVGAILSGQTPNWRQAAPFDAVHLPRKLTAEAKVLDDPRRKVNRPGFRGGSTL
jgi:DNA primase catalytic core